MTVRLRSAHNELRDKLNERIHCLKNSRKPIAILGAGSWGTALALYLANCGQTVRLWTHEPSHSTAMQTERVNNRFLPGYAFPDSLHIMSHLSECYADECDILIAVPSSGFRDVLFALKKHIDVALPISWATKGLDPEGMLLHEVAQEILGTQRAYAILSGPSFAHEVAKGLPTAVVIASQQATYANNLMTRFNSASFRVYLSTDIIGVEVGGVVKNVLAIATGISDGMRLGANARSALITRGLAEMIRLGTALGGQADTLNGLAGLGDLVLTCTDDQSRNRRFGLALGRGQTISAAEHAIGQVIEGKHNTELVVALAQKHGVSMPIAETVWEVLQEKISLPQAIQNLLSRATKVE
jgi:glycerol-3-phosphate dehydrogenase (NAD(P)+)